MGLSGEVVVSSSFPHLNMRVDSLAPLFPPHMPANVLLLSLHTYMPHSLFSHALMDIETPSLPSRSVLDRKAIPPPPMCSRTFQVHFQIERPSSNDFSTVECRGDCSPNTVFPLRTNWSCPVRSKKISETKKGGPRQVFFSFAHTHTLFYPAARWRADKSAGQDVGKKCVALRNVIETLQNS